MKSILKEAEILHIKDNREKKTNETLSFFSFKKIIAAQNCLLYESSLLLFEIGRKFSFYLFPFGKDFDESIEAINQLIRTDWNVQVIEKSENMVKIKVKNCIFCSETGVSCDLFVGFLVHTLEKTLTSHEEVTYGGNKKDLRKPDHNDFILTLNIQKNNI
jgi:predicted hydrocarbon binding protein